MLGAGWVALSVWQKGSILVLSVGSSKLYHFLRPGKENISQESCSQLLPNSPLWNVHVCLPVRVSNEDRISIGCVTANFLSYVSWDAHGPSIYYPSPKYPLEGGGERLLNCCGPCGVDAPPTVKFPQQFDATEGRCSAISGWRLRVNSVTEDLGVTPRPDRVRMTGRPSPKNRRILKCRRRPFGPTGPNRPQSHPGPIPTTPCIYPGWFP